MSPNEDLQHAGILYLLLYFKWTWIGVLVMDNYNGERIVQGLLPEFSKHGVCIAFIGYSPRGNFLQEFPNMMEQGSKVYNQIMGSKANVFVAFGRSYSINDLMFLPYLSDIGNVKWKEKGKVWILTAQMDFALYVYHMTWDADEIHGTLAFTVHSKDLPGFRKFVERRNPSNAKEDGFIQKIWHHAFNCRFPNQVQDWKKGEEGENCTGQEKLESLPASFFEKRMTGHSYSIYNSVYAVAHAAQAMLSFKTKHRRVINGMSLNVLRRDQWLKTSMLKHYGAVGKECLAISLHEMGQ
ncbi:UNVERIFIED_CONTAM: hypothetical protein K2H54_032101 [Gekko kuhli]